MSFAPAQFYKTNADPEEVFQEFRHPLSLHPELFSSSEQLVSILNLKPTIFEIEVALEALAIKGKALL
jgi:hypothetical protein